MKKYSKPEITEIIGMEDIVVTSGGTMNNMNQYDNWENGENRDQFFGGN